MSGVTLILPVRKIYTLYSLSLFCRSFPLQVRLQSVALSTTKDDALWVNVDPEKAAELNEKIGTVI